MTLHTQARQRMKVVRLLLPALALAAGSLVSPARPVHAVVDPVATVGAPFGGTWGRQGDLSSVPPRHPSNGDWGVDFFGQGQAIAVNIWSDTWNLPATLTIKELAPTCGAEGTSGYAGYTVRVAVTINGRYVGWVSYGHVAKVAGLFVGKQLTTGAVIGYSAFFGAKEVYRDGYLCYALTSASGSHVHMAVFNQNNWSCYESYTPGKWLNSGIRMGLVGGAYGSRSGKICPY